MMLSSGAIHIFVVFTALGISVFIGERILAITLAAVIFASLAVLSAVIFTSWHQWHNIIYLFPVTNFLLHYFILCIYEFKLTDLDPQLLEVFIHTTLPSLCCLILSWIISCALGLQFSLQLLLSGFFVLMWCLSKRDYFLSNRSGKRNYGLLWQRCVQFCILLLMEIFPLGAHIVHIYSNWISAHAGVQLLMTVLLFCGVQFLSSIARGFGKLDHCASHRRPFFGSIAVICAVLLFLHNTNIWSLKQRAPTELSWLLLSALLFSLLMICSIYRIRAEANSDAVHRVHVISLGIGILLCICCITTTQRVPKSFDGGGWLTGRLGFILPLCTLFSVLPVILFRHIEPEILEIMATLFILAFYTAEWSLFQSMLINEALFISSTLALGLFLFVLHLKNKRHKPVNLATNDSGFLSTDFLNLCVVAPAVTKTLLIGVNRLEYFERSMSFLSPVVHQRIRYEKGAILGIYMTIVGLVSGSRILDGFTKCSAYLVHRTGILWTNHNGTFEQIFGQTGLFLYFELSIYLFWPSIMRILFGTVPSGCVAFQSALLLTGISLYLSPRLNGPVQSKLVGAQSAIRNSARHCVVAAFFLLGALVLLGSVSSAGWTLLLLLVGVPATVYVIVCLATSMALKKDNILVAFRYNWIISSMEWGLLLGLVLSVLFVRMDLTLLGIPSLFCSVLYATCICLLTQARFSDSLREAMEPSQPDLLPILTLRSDESKKLQMFLLRARTRFMLMNLLLGVAALVGISACQWFVANDFPDYNSLFPNPVPIAFFVLSQLASDRVNRSPVRSRNSKKILLNVDNPMSCSECLLLHVAINITVVLVIISLLYWCSWTLTDLRVLFLPWFLFGLVGTSFERSSKFLPLAGFTLLLLISMSAQSHYMESFNPPVPTFTRRLFRASYSPWLRWGEVLLTLSLIPIHVLFLMHLTKASTLQIVHWILPNSKFQSWTPLIAHGLSHVCASITCSAYGLSLFCLLYLFLASSVASAVFGVYSFLVCCYAIVRIDVRLELDFPYAL
ncbi:hypothetical protein T265_10917 [Opisthorchis viverrini]|uniref:Uncharacterized protein n=1 Tax=Opisthorchis viverrini TaxID=6198 RepID=A0A074ZZG7_OPIVI|nr:hypothetical protein T265_10917 [Opisthorchis viverrini]KER20569.1 hypothetical protein T265_10917 [Opisthorchis viverrini]